MKPLPERCVFQVWVRFRGVGAFSRGGCAFQVRYCRCYVVLCVVNALMACVNPIP